MGKANQLLSLMLKVFAVIAIIAVGIIVWQTCSGSSLIQRIDKNPPTDEVAPFEIKTMIKTYLAKEATIDGNSVVMNGWYERVEGKWIYHDSEITLPPVLRPIISSRLPPSE